MKKLFILGAGASADFSPSTYAGGGIPNNRNEFMPTTFPTTNSFLYTAIKMGKLYDNSKLTQFITEKYGISFNQLAGGEPLDIETVYNDIDILYQKIDEDVTFNSLSKTDVKAFTLIIHIEELIEDVICHYINVYDLCENYTSFANHIAMTGADVISFNWDTFLDDALYETGKWYFESGYGFDFERIYQDRKQIEKKGIISSSLLLKPHGSINWFRYRDHYSSATDGFTGESVSDEDRYKTFLMLFSRDKIGIHPIHKRLNMAKGWKPPLKMPCGLDIIYPSKKSRAWVRMRNYILIRDKMTALFKDADEIFFIGFALKDIDADEFRDIEVKETMTMTLVNLDHSEGLVSRYNKVFKTDRIKFAVEKTFKDYCQSLPNKKRGNEVSNLHTS